jgi:hypothetical protein
MAQEDRCHPEMKSGCQAIVGHQQFADGFLIRSHRCSVHAAATQPAPPIAAAHQPLATLVPGHTNGVVWVQTENFGTLVSADSSWPRVNWSMWVASERGRFVAKPDVFLRHAKAHPLPSLFLHSDATF